MRTVVSCKIRTCSAKQGMSQSTGTLTLRQVRAVCTQREPTGRVIIVIVAEREEREEKEGRKENDGREKEIRGERKSEETLSLVCRLKTSPCVRSKRFRVYWQNARMLNTCGRFAGTHGCVLNLHTETFLTYTRVFSAFQAALHTTHTTQHTTPHTTHNAHTTHTNAWTRAQSTTDRDLECERNCETNLSCDGAMGVSFYMTS